MLALLLGLVNQSAAGFDTCIYLDPAGNVLRMSPDQSVATLTRSDGAVITCSIAAPSPPDRIRRGACEDRPDWTFDVFSGASDPGLDQDDMLAFRGELWARKCAFTR